MTTKSQTVRESADNFADLAALAEDKPTKKRFKRMEFAWLALAEEQDWLDGQVPSVHRKNRGAD